MIDYTTGEFAGIKIKVEKAVSRFGRRVTVVETYADDPERKDGSNNKDDGVYDIGPKQENILVDIFFTEDDLPNVRDQLFAAIRAGTAGELKLPSSNLIAKVRPEVASHNYSRRDINFETLQINFWVVPDASETSPKGLIDTQKEVADKGVDLESKVAVTFPEVFKTEVPDFVKTSDTTILEDLTDTTRDIIKFATLAKDKATDLFTLIDDTHTDAVNIIRAPGDYIERLKSISNGITGAINDTHSTAYVQEKVLENFDTGWGEIRLTTPSEAAKKDNALTVQNAYDALTLKGLADSYSSTEYDNFDDAVSDLQSFRDLSDTVLDRLADDGDLLRIREELIDLSTAVSEDLITRGANLPPLVLLTSYDQQPILVTGYNLYSDNSEFQSIIDRNTVRNPNFPKLDLLVIR